MISFFMKGREERMKRSDLVFFHKGEERKGKYVFFFFFGWSGNRRTTILFPAVESQWKK